MVIPPPDTPSLGADLDALLRRRGFVAIHPGPQLAIDLRYATEDNFLGRPLYGGFDRLFLHPLAAEKLQAATKFVQLRGTGHRLLVFDGVRPNRIQRLMWAAVENGPQRIYVADPAVGSVHAYGLAVDLTLLDPDGRECDMGTPFDDFSPLAEPQREAEFLASGALTNRQIGNRRLLRGLMEAAGFHPIAIEWWHFDAVPPDEVRARFTLIE